MSSSQTPTFTEYATLFTQQLRMLGDTRQWEWDEPAGRLKPASPADGSAAPLEFIYLDSLYREWLRLAAAARPDGLRQAAQSMLHRSVPEGVDDVRAHLLPLVRAAADRGQAIILSPTGQPGLVHRALCGSLEIQLGVDTPTNIMRVGDSQLAKWNLSAEEAFAIALDNLRAMSVQPMRAMAPGIYESAWADDHDAARLLLIDVLQRHPITGAPVVAVPVRGRLLLTGDQNASGVAALVRQLELAQEQPRAMPPQLLRLVDGQWTDFVPAAHVPRLRALRLQSEGQACANQKHLLDERAKKRGEDIFVASLMVGRDADGTPSRSACVWSKGVVALLPKAELLSLVDPHGDKADAVVIDWDLAMPVVGHLMRKTGDVPPRFHVTAYPDADQLARLRQAAAANPLERAAAPASHASNRGNMTLSPARLRALQPQLFGADPSEEADRRRRQWIQLIGEQLADGDARAAVVIDAEQGIVAAYADELDGVALLKFDPRIAHANDWQAGTRLLSVNTYNPRAQGLARDLVPGPKDSGHWGNFRPMIADLLTDDAARLAAAKAGIGEDEWTRALQMGRSAHAAKASKPRDGRPLGCSTPGAPETPAAALQDKPAAASPAPARAPRPRRPVQPVSRFEPKPLVVTLVCLAIAIVGVTQVGNANDTGSAVVAWLVILFFAVMAWRYGRAFYKALFPSAE